MYTEQELISKLIPIFQRFPVKRAALFGGYSRGEQTDKSDVDIILEIDMSHERAAYFYIFWDELENATKLKTDLITFGSLNAAPSSFRNKVLKELRYIYET